MHSRNNTGVEHYVTAIYQNTTQKTNDLSNTNYQQPDDELGAPQWYAVSTPLVAHLSS
jgi:hypothetical protein